MSTFVPKVVDAAPALQGEIGDAPAPAGSPASGGAPPMRGTGPAAPMASELVRVGSGARSSDLPSLPPGQAEEYRANLAHQLAQLEQLAGQGDLPDELVQAALALAQQAREGIRPTLLSLLETAMQNVRWEQSPQQHQAFIATISGLAERMEADEQIAGRIEALAAELRDWDIPKPLDRTRWRRNVYRQTCHEERLEVLEATTRTYRCVWHTTHGNSLREKVMNGVHSERCFRPDRQGWVQHTLSMTLSKGFTYVVRVQIRWNVLTGACTARYESGEPLEKRFAQGCAQLVASKLFPGMDLNRLEVLSG